MIVRLRAPFLISLVLVLGLWEAAFQARLVSPVLFAGPSAITAAFVKLTSDGTLAEHLGVTLTELALGFLAAVVAGIPTGFLLGTLPTLETALSPYLMAFYSTPRVAFFPLLITWFGFGLQTQVVLVFLSAFFPLCINAWAGVKTVEPVLVRAGRSFGCNRLQLYRKILLPASVPYVVAGARVAIGQALIAVYVAELLGGTSGIGYLLARAGLEFRTGELFAAAIILAGLGLLFTSCFRWLERRVAPWRVAAAL